MDATLFERRNQQTHEAVLPLENGDRLTLSEFRQRYETMPHIKKAELIEGVVYMPSPVRFSQHGEPHSHLLGWLFAYRAATPFVAVGDNCTVRLDSDNEPQPDAMLRIVTEAGGQSRLEDDYVVGPPELVAEIVGSSASYDLYDKKNVYRRNGVTEYVVWVVHEKRIEWFVLADGRYDRLDPNAENVFRSAVFPGLWLDAGALIGGDLSKLVEILRHGLDSEDHARFVAKLSDKARS